MDGPGLSLFQGAESIKVDTSINRLEEEEAIEDQKRRNEELKNELQNAFDDLIDDDDYTADMSGNFQTHLSNGNESKDFRVPSNGHHEIEEPKADVNHFNGRDDDQFREEVDKLNIIIDSKCKEVENVSKMVHEERRKNEELKKRLALSEAERERAIMNKKQTHELLVESKAKASELEDTIAKLKVKIKSAESSNNELVGELERTRAMLSDAMQKYHMVEKNVGYTADRHANLAIKQATERHSAQMEMMQQQIENLRTKLEDKEQEFKNLDTRYKELQRTREALLVDKAETINQLARSLEDSQRQCHQLMSKQDFAHENIRLQRLSTALEKQTEDMQVTINKLTAKLEATTNELQIMDSVLGESGEVSETLRRLSLTQGNLIGSTPLSSSDRVTRLKNELFRSMAGQKEKRDEIRKLQEQLQAKDDEIKKLKDDENNALVGMQTCKEENLRLENRLRILESEMNNARHDQRLENKEKSFRQELQDEIDRLRGELKTSREKCDILQTEAADLHEKLKSLENKDLECSNLTARLKELDIDFEELKQEYENLKSNYDIALRENEGLKLSTSSEKLRLDLEKHRFLLKDAQSECDRFKNLYVDISAAKEELVEQLLELKAKDLNKELYVQREKCLNLERALQLSEVKCNELEKLLESQRNQHSREIENLKEKIRKDDGSSSKAAKDSSNNCTKCIEQLALITKYEIQNLKLQSEHSDALRDLEELKSQLDEANHHITVLNDKLGLKEERDKLINELKIKAQQFEEYIKNQTSSKETSGVSSPKQIESKDQSVGTSPELELNHNRRQLEARIRDEMAKVFATEIKDIENKFQLNIMEVEEQNNALKLEFKKITYELELRQNEVEILKEAILTERSKMKIVFDKKDTEARQVIEKQNSILKASRDEIKMKQNRISQLMKELEERSAQIEAERQSMKIVMKQWEDNIQKGNISDEDWRRRLTELQQEHDQFVNQLQAKYQSAKKTAANYKKYSEDKEKHMLQEYDRLKSGYESSLAKIENQMKEVLHKQNREMKERIQEIESSYEAKLNSMRENLDENKLV